MWDRDIRTRQSNSNAAYEGFWRDENVTPAASITLTLLTPCEFKPIHLCCSSQSAPRCHVDIFLGIVFRLHDHGPIKNEPKDRFCIVFKFVPPLVVRFIINRFRINTFSLGDWEFPHTVWVGLSIRTRTVGSLRNNGDSASRTWHRSSPFNSSSNKKRCSLVKMRVRAAYR